jgi:hypothetical protein
LPSASIWVTVSPQQCLCGAVFYRIGSLRIRLAVLPKLWKPNRTGAAPVFMLKQETDELQIVAYEGETICIRVEGGSQWVNSQERILLEFLRGVMTPEADADDAALQFVRFARQPRGLLEFDSKAESDRFLEAALMDLYRLAAIAECPLKFGLGHRLSAALGQDELLLPLLHMQFIDCVSRAINDARRSYFETTTECESIRGRASGGSLLRALHGVSRRIECTFDDFEYATPLLRVILTCLMDIVRFSRDSKHSLLSALARSNATAVESLRRKIGSIPPLAPSAAFRLSNTIKPTRNEGVWTEALTLAPLVLARRGLHDSAATSTTAGAIGGAASAGPDTAYMLKLRLDTARAWERMLERAAGPLGEVLSQGSLPSPWQGLGGELRPDIQLRLPDGQRLVVDAKYKNDSAGAVGRDDLLQMFAYSHLAEWGVGPRRLLLVRARPTSVTRDSLAYRRHQHRYTPDDTTELVTASLRFPMRRELDRSDRYLSCLGAELQAIVLQAMA